MLQHNQPWTSGALPAIIVIAGSSVIIFAIVVWLVYQVARISIEKATPETIAPVVLALGSLLEAVGVYLPWSRTFRATGIRTRGSTLRQNEEAANPDVAAGERDA
jgi:hypothetical protein